MSIKDVTAPLDAVLGEIDATRESLNLAVGLIDDATTPLGSAVSGTADPDALQTLAWFGEPVRFVFTALKTSYQGDAGRRLDRDRVPRAPSVRITREAGSRSGCSGRVLPVRAR
ncbi:hypothetical protein [Saccharothrix violaceirubra]|uniref:Uncharacterized protein n=1 Tax=Saccharothrix violaceirubra TaxID=413306 RepID=A0A7W7T2W5_9PSEU|nr:hypothetical protein [Saccharothrix violaceirubra]MBB4965605.1 hypothetical protein [Saccharothrix violaceirubra]